jgi:molybdopterin-guanine dinucleotide biosynthesis protein MobB
VDSADTRSRRPVLVSIAAPSGSGKTTLIEALLSRLSGWGLRVGAIKSDAHRVELDVPGKDTHRMRSSGAQVTALVSRDQVAVFRDVPGAPIELTEIVRLFFSSLDVVLAEGFRSQHLPTVVVRRRGVSLDSWDWPEDVIAVATDDEADAPGERLDLNDPEQIAEFLCERFELRADPEQRDDETASSDRC